MKGNLAAPGGPLPSMPTWPHASGHSATSAFFCPVGSGEEGRWRYCPRVDGAHVRKSFDGREERDVITTAGRSPHTLEQRVTRRLPVGAEVIPGGGVHFRVWAPRRGRVEVVFEGDAGPGQGICPPVTRSEPRREWLLLRVDGRGGCRRPLPLPPRRRRRAVPGPGLALPARRPARPLPGHRPGRLPVDRPRLARHGAGGPGALRDAHRHLHPGGDLGGGGPRAAGPGGPRHHRAGGHAGGRVPRPVRLGLRRRRPVRPHAPLRHARRLPPLRGPRPRASGLGVILDVVYNHLGPDGNYLREFSDGLLHRPLQERVGRGDQLRRRQTPARCASSSSPTPATGSTSSTSTACASTPRSRSSTPRPSTSWRPSPGGCGRRRAGGPRSWWPRTSRRTSGWCARRSEAATGWTRCGTTTSTTAPTVALTGHNEAYYTDYLGTPQEFISAAKYGYLYQGQWYRWQQQAARHARAPDLPPAAFVNFLQNHDQVANSGLGLRCHQLTSPGRYRAMTALLLLMPGTPMLFQGQEFAASAPFHYFADHQPELAELVRRGRAEFLTQFRSLALPETQALLRRPVRPADLRALQARPVRARAARGDLRAAPGPAPAAAGGSGLPRTSGRAAWTGPCWARRRSCCASSGTTRRTTGCCWSTSAATSTWTPPRSRSWPRPAATRWQVRWSSEAPRYGGSGTAPPDTETNWRLPGEAALVLRPRGPRGGGW